MNEDIKSWQDQESGRPTRSIDLESKGCLLCLVFDPLWGSRGVGVFNVGINIKGTMELRRNNGALDYSFPSNGRILASGLLLCIMLLILGGVVQYKVIVIVLWPALTIQNLFSLLRL